MIKAMKISAAIAGIALLSSCATSFPVGTFYTDVTLPMGATSASGGSKSGVSTCQSILLILATGDCSVQAAKANGGISEVTHIDFKANNILGLIGTYTTTVYGN